MPPSNVSSSAVSPSSPIALLRLDVPFASLLEPFARASAPLGSSPTDSSKVSMPSDKAEAPLARASPPSASWPLAFCALCAPAASLSRPSLSSPVPLRISFMASVSSLDASSSLLVSKSSVLKSSRRPAVAIVSEVFISKSVTSALTSK